MAGAYYIGCPDADYKPHFLDCCNLCQRHISLNNDIFMYRGNTPFCSQECRQEQIEMDEANERKWKISSSSNSSSSSSSKRSSNKVRSPNNESTKEYDANKSVRTGTVAVA